MTWALCLHTIGKKKERRGAAFTAVPSNVPEHPLRAEAPGSYALRMSLEKARTVANRMTKRCWVIGADTIVIIDGRVLGKPRNRKEAVSMLKKIQGKTHTVITAVTLFIRPGREITQTSVRTRVTMKKMSDDEIERYVDTGEPFDKAGGYAIQGKGGYLVKKIQGSYSNVVGLPLYELYDLLEKACGRNR